MKRLMALAMGLILSLSLVVVANAAPAGKAAAPKAGKGMQNAKKVMQAKFERTKKTQDIQKKAHAKRQQAMKK